MKQFAAFWTKRKNGVTPSCASGRRCASLHFSGPWCQAPPRTERKLEVRRLCPICEEVPAKLPTRSACAMSTESPCLRRRNGRLQAVAPAVASLSQAAWGVRVVQRAHKEACIEFLQTEGYKHTSKP